LQATLFITIAKINIMKKEINKSITAMKCGSIEKILFMNHGSSAIVILSIFFATILTGCGATPAWTKWRSDQFNTGTYSDIKTSGKTLWTNQEGTSLSSGILDEGGAILYFNGRNNQILAVDVNTGVPKFPSFVAGGAIESTPAVDINTIYFGANDGVFYAVNTSGLTKKWSYPTGGRITSSAIVSGEKVYVGSWDGKVYAFNRDNGTIEWTFATGARILSSPAIDPNGVLYIGSDDGYVYALDYFKGGLIWKFKTGGIVAASPAYSTSTGNVYVGSLDGNFYAIAPNGSELWRVNTGGGFTERHSAVVLNNGPKSNDRVCFGNESGDFFCYESSTSFVKVLIASINISDRVFSSPVAARKSDVIILGTLGRLLKLTIEPTASTTTYVFSQTTIKQSALPNRIWGSPSVGKDGTIFIANDGGMQAIQ
jgi:outer membrane protein assembly factor BamB